MMSSGGSISRALLHFAPSHYQRHGSICLASLYLIQQVSCYVWHTEQLAPSKCHTFTWWMSRTWTTEQKADHLRATRDLRSIFHLSLFGFATATSRSLDIAFSLTTWHYAPASTTSSGPTQTPSINSLCRIKIFHKACCILAKWTLKK